MRGELRNVEWVLGDSVLSTRAVVLPCFTTQPQAKSNAYMMAYLRERKECGKNVGRVWEECGKNVKRM